MSHTKHLAKKLSLPPFLEPKREEIEKLVRPIDTVRSTKEFIKRVKIEIVSRRASSFSGVLELLAFFIWVIIKVDNLHKIINELSVNY